MAYRVKETFYTLQGEGAHTGRPALFVRFAGCNLWTGREEDRHRATCTFCDTDFVGTDGEGGGRFETPGDLVSHALSFLPHGGTGGYVVCTGGEPLLQLDEPLVEAFHSAGLEVAVETNGTQPAPPGLDWICVSPKAGADLRLTRGNELKLVFPQPGALPEAFESLDFQRFYLQPMDGPAQRRNIQLTIEYCLAHPRWRLSLQTHKALGLR